MLNKEKIKYLIDMLESKEEVEENILDKLFELRLNFINENVNKNKNYFEAITQAYILYEEIEKDIKDEKIMNLIEDWMCLENESLGFSNEIYYKAGMKDGINVILIALEDFCEDEVK